MIVGLWLLRHRRAKDGIPSGQYRAWDSAVILRLAWTIMLLVMPWYVFEDDAIFSFAELRLVGYPLKMGTVMSPSGMQRKYNQTKICDTVPTNSFYRYCVAGIGILVVSCSSIHILDEMRNRGS